MSCMISQRTTFAFLFTKLPRSNILILLAFLLADCFIITSTTNGQHKKPTRKPRNISTLCLVLDRNSPLFPHSPFCIITSRQLLSLIVVLFQPYYTILYFTLSFYRMEASAINAIATRITQEWVQQLRQRGRDIPSTIHITPNEHMLVVQLTLMWATLDLRHLTIPKAIKEQSFLDELRMYSRRVLRYEDKELLDRALEVIPVHRFYEEAAEKPNAPLDDEVIRRLLHWFKNDFFTWINQPPCDFCGASETQSAGTADPSEDDRRWGARIVELYKCTKCRKVTRFARYNDPGKLLETRRGRCGEWANCFTLCCRAIGSEARLVLDKTDHVWTEIYSENKQRWVHCDPAEEAFDQPMLYTVGWGKKLTYCIGFSCDEAVDVTKRYTKDWSQVLERRNLVDENVLAKFLDDLSAERQKDLPQERKAILKERRMREKKELDETTPGIKESETVGRQSGSTKWKKARGEYRG